MRTISVADYFVEFLIANGVSDVFGYQGGMIAYIFDSLGRYKDKINYHSCGSEQGAAFAACSYSQASGKLGVAISTSGPGFTNLLTGMANAWFDSIPVLFVSGNVNTKDKKRNNTFRQNGFQEIQAAQIARPITKMSYEIELDTNYIECFDNALLTAMSYRKGPVYLDLPINVCRETIEVDEIKPVLVKTDKQNLNLDKYFEEFINSKKPVIIAGAGINQANYKTEFNELIDLLKIPVISTMPATDLLPSESKYMMGYMGGTSRREPGIVLQNADYVLSIGTRLCSKQVGHNMSLFAPKANKFIRVDIDNSEFERKLKEDEIEINVNLEEVIDSFIEYLKKNNNQYAYSKWTDNCSKVKELLSKFDNSRANVFYKEVSKLFPTDSNIMLDVGKNQTYGAQSLTIKDKTKVYMSAGLGSMGYSIPAAIGACYGNKKPTFAFTGDGGAQMNIQELNTIAKNKLPIKIFVLNNKALGNILIFQENFLDSRFVATTEERNDYFSCDFTAIAKAYGIDSYTIKDENDLLQYQEELNNDKPVLFEYVYDDCPAYPGIVAGGEYLKEGTGIDKEILDTVKSIIQRC